MSSTERERLFDEAAKIFVSLKDAPSDPAAIEARDAFLARGEEARDVYAKVSKVWTASGGRKRAGTTLSLIFALVIAASAYVWFDDVRMHILADLSTGRVPIEQKLASGDLVKLDAGSALIDRTDGDVRRVEVLDGAAFFDVTTDGRPFTVEAGDLTIRVLGTAFEASMFDDGGLVGVTEGTVEVTYGADTWNLTPGDVLRYQEDTGVRVSQTDPARIAGWRTDRLVVDGVPFGEIVEIIDRRLPGPIILLDSGLAEQPVTGGFNLDDPGLALQAAASGLGARGVLTSPFGAIVRGSN